MQSIANVGLAAYQTNRPLFYQTPIELQGLVDRTLPRGGLNSVEALVSEMDALVNTYSINQSTVNFMAFPESGNSKAAVAAGMLVPLWNQNLISVDKSAPIATFIEVQVIEWLRQLVGYDCVPATSAINIGGVATTGGVMSNTVGLLVARSRAFPDAREKGLTHEKKTPYLLVADKTLEHYSHKAAFWWLGLGEANVVAVKGTGYDFDVADLEEKLGTYNTGNNVVVAVICMAGDSRTMTIQNIAEIQAVTAKNNVWLHVDACQGGIGIFASNRAELCADYRLADSISIDPHKGLGVPYSSSFCLFKDQEALQSIAKSTDITIAKGSFDIGQVTPFLGSRPFDTVKLWALIKYHGLDGLARNVDYRIALTQEWARFVNSSKYLVSMNDPLLTAISLSLDPRKLGIDELDGELLGKLNKEIHDRCYQSGWLVLHCFDLIDYENRLGLDDTKPLRVLGTNFGNVLLDASHFPKIMAYLDKQIDEMLSLHKLKTSITS
jgi:glutamate/tyrosine decarboxylase-like PLP-dependent enzyme